MRATVLERSRAIGAGTRPPRSPAQALGGGYAPGQAWRRALGSLRRRRPLADGCRAETALIYHHGVDLRGSPRSRCSRAKRAGRPCGVTSSRSSRSPASGGRLRLGTATWRADPDSGRELGYDEPALAAVNRRAVAFAEELRADMPAWDRPVLIEAVLGPRGDAYAPSSLMTAAEAERYHSTQLQTLADSACDVACALTITYADEAIGMVRAAEAAGLPISVSFTVETDGRLPSGQSSAQRDRAGRCRDGGSAAPLHDQLRASDALRRRAQRRGALARAAARPARERVGAQSRRARRVGRSGRRRSRTSSAGGTRSCAARCRTSCCSAAAAAPTSGT